MKRRRGEKIPDEWVYCPVCGRPYGFIGCRVTLQNPKRERCLRCAVKEEGDAKIKTIHATKLDMPLMGMGGAPGAVGSPKPDSVGSTPTPPADSGLV